MSFILNEYDVEDAARRWAQHPTLGPATATLQNLVAVVNNNSDGWPYWRLPAKASVKLQKLIHDANAKDHRRDPRDPVTVTAAQVKSAYTPIRSFLTKHHLSIEFIAPGVNGSESEQAAFDRGWARG